VDGVYSTSALQKGTLDKIAHNASLHLAGLAFVDDILSAHLSPFIARPVHFLIRCDLPARLGSTGAISTSCPTWRPFYYLHAYWELVEDRQQ
jgi:hypothetical protein